MRKSWPDAQRSPQHSPQAAAPRRRRTGPDAAERTTRALNLGSPRVRMAESVSEIRKAPEAASMQAPNPEKKPRQRAESKAESKLFMQHRTRLEVVKIGGSLYRASALEGILNALSRKARSTCVVLVPGGGHFADTVRHAQVREGFSDAEAHLRALEAMDEAGAWLGRCLEARGSPPMKFEAEQLKMLSQTATGSGLTTGLWLVSCFGALSRETALPAAWQTTSDTVALWCAQILSADELYLCKAAAPGARSLDALAQAEYVDRQFPTTFSSQPLPCSVLWPGAPEPFLLWPHPAERTQEAPDRTAKL